MNIRKIFNLSMYIVCLAGCTSDKKGLDLVPLDVRVSYIEKEIKLEDVANIEYLQIELDDGFLFTEWDTPHITSDKIIIGRRSNGDILVFSRDGKPLCKFNRSGNGPEDYPYITDVDVYDEDSDELYVRSHNKIMVYSSSGEFRRKLSLLEDASVRQIVNYDSETLMLYDEQDAYPTPFTLISKKNGSVVETVDMPFVEKIDLRLIVSQNGRTVTYVPMDLSHILKYKDGFLLNDFSNDTLYFFSRNKELLPVIVRKPPINSMAPFIILSSFVEAENYDFMFTTTIALEDSRFPRKYLMRNKNIGSLYRQKVTFNDYKGKEVFISPMTIRFTHDCKLGLIVLSLAELQDAKRENKLSGKLEELVDNSDEDGNDIFMLLHFK